MTSLSESPVNKSRSRPVLSRYKPNIGNLDQVRIKMMFLIKFGFVLDFQKNIFTFVLLHCKRIIEIVLIIRLF